MGNNHEIEAASRRRGHNTAGVRRQEDGAAGTHVGDCKPPRRASELRRLYRALLSWELGGDGLAPPGATRGEQSEWRLSLGLCRFHGTRKPTEHGNDAHNRLV